MPETRRARADLIAARRHLTAVAGTEETDAGLYDHGGDDVA